MADKMTNDDAIRVLECMAIDMVGTSMELTQTNPMYDVVQQRIEAINLAQAAIYELIVNVRDDDFGAVLNCAIRYCLGRRTYMPRLVTDYIRPLLPRLSERTLNVMEQDIIEQERFGYGDECDKDTWMRFLSDVRKAKSK